MYYSLEDIAWLKQQECNEKSQNFKKYICSKKSKKTKSRKKRRKK